MKKIYLLLTFISILLFSGCFLDRTSEQIENIDNNLSGDENILGKDDDLEIETLETGNILEELDDYNNPSESGNDEENLTILIPSTGLVYRNDKYGFQIKFGKERNGGKIYGSWRKYRIDNYNPDYSGVTKNPFFIFTMPSLSPRRPGTFGLISSISVYTYEKYEQARKIHMDPECDMCNLEGFDNAIVGKNNKYYFLLGRNHYPGEELKNIFPSLECREKTHSNGYGTSTIMECDGLEYINGEPKKTGKDWLEQLFPAESFEFFDVE